MMQMLAAGGLEPVTDNQRVADHNNPAGYLEFEPVKKLKEDSSWLPSARGKVIKVISQLLFDLPRTERYAIVLMQRELREVLASQEKMLARLGHKGAPHDMMRLAYQNHLRKLAIWLQSQSHMRVCRVDYSSVVANALSNAHHIKEFLGLPIDVAQMITVVDESLYRHRSPVVQ